MIVYDNRDLRFILLARFGSIIISRFVFVPALVSTIICGVILGYPGFRNTCVPDTLGQTYCGAIGWVVIFRTQIAFKRWFEGVEHVQDMYSKWADAFTAIAVFIETSILKQQAAGNTAHVDRLKSAKCRLLHFFSLMSSLASHSIAHARDEEFDIVRQDVIFDNVLCNRTATHDASGNMAPQRGRKASSITGKPNCMMKNGKPSVIGCKVIGELTRKESDQLEHAQDKVLTVCKWVLCEVSDLTITGVLTTAPPIVTRIFQELSEGMSKYFQAMKIAIIPFPFPYAQVVAHGLLGFYFLCPFVVAYGEDAGSVEVTSYPPWFATRWPSLVFTFVAVCGYSALNEISIELEEPFGEDANDFPPRTQQLRFVSAVEDCYFAQIPQDFDLQAFCDHAFSYQKAADSHVPAPPVVQFIPPPPPVLKQHTLVESFADLHEAVVIYGRRLCNFADERSSELKRIKIRLYDLAYSVAKAEGLTKPFMSPRPGPSTASGDAAAGPRSSSKAG